MNKQNNNRALTAVLLSVGLLSIVSTSATAAPPIDLSESATFPAGSLCDFAVRLDITGKAKVIGPDPDITKVPASHKVISPNFKVTTTAVDAEGNAISEPVTYTATGTVFFTLTERANKSPYYEVKATGNNLLFVPGEGLVFVTGNANYGIETDKATEVRPVSGEARRVNICDPLEVN